MKNQSKIIHNIDRKKHVEKLDLEDPFLLGGNSFGCNFCGSTMHPYKQDEYGDIVMACDNIGCKNSEGFDGSLNSTLSKLVREFQLHSRYYVDYFGNTDGSFYNPYRKAKYWEKGTEYI